MKRKEKGNRKFSRTELIAFNSVISEIAKGEETSNSVANFLYEELGIQKRVNRAVMRNILSKLEKAEA
jgi:hypothetical protein